jgi:hypothetical protein
VRRGQDNMSFIDIKDPQKREQIVQDYIKTLSLVREKAENEKAKGLEQQIKLEKQFNPIINATKQSTDKITNELKKNRAVPEGLKGIWKKNYAQPAIDYYLNVKKNIDKYYGIQKINGEYKMGEATVKVDDQSNIHVGNERFEGTPGLWSLIMLNQPTDYTNEDLINYEDLVEKTQVIFHPIQKSDTDRPQMTNKYKNFLSEFEKSYDLAEYNEENIEDDKEGEGVVFLPGNINGLLDRLRLVYAERKAGNISATTNELVGILDELLRVGYINRTEYNAVCQELSC